MCCLRVVGTNCYLYMNEGRNSPTCRLPLSPTGTCGCFQGFHQTTMRSSGQKDIALRMTCTQAPNSKTSLDAEEAQAQQQLLGTIAEWFAFEVEEYLAERHYEVSHHCDRVVPRGHAQIDEDFSRSRGFRPPRERMHRQIKRAYQLQLRGKQLFQILERFLNAPNRGTRYNVASLQEIALKMTPAHPLMGRLMQEIEQAVADQ